ncbi:GGDEF domain-containing protein [Pararhizobium haloflavum]|uniref:GGDEF domain-containing protein n=1 Tax=Pararhizobium haloflavum TaxID=2037914 RepID=UPI000C19F196|nr:GGDEF domain-containing protein [Pararhizobium haloflavum]
MIFDQISLLAAIGFASTALCVTLFVAWLGARQDRFLLSWSIGMALIVGGVVFFGAIGETYLPTVQFTSFALVIVGFSFVYVGAMQFRTGETNWTSFGWTIAIAVTPTAAAFALGYSGTGTMLANCGIALVIGRIAHQYWIGRSEAPIPMVANTLLYGATSLSFLLCGVVLLQEGQFVLSQRPENWAEDVNAIVIIIGISSIGALSLAMNQSRIARRHRVDAITDQLTGLLNRRALFECVDDTPVQPGTALIVLDLDHFKEINDQFGHDAGDFVLRRFAKVVQESIRATDMAARLGGEEFCIVLPNITPSHASGIAERIRAKFEMETIETAIGVVRATVSGGLVMCAGKPENFASLLSQSDAALYRAKRNGRNQVHSVGLKQVA